MMFHLYEDQQKIHDEIVDYCANFKLKPPGMEDVELPWKKKLLIGYAGTGKTTLVGAIVRTLQTRFSMKIIISAPTHKAVRVAKAKSGIEGVQFATLQKVLGVKAKKNFNTGEMEFEPDYDAPFSLDSNTFLIVDEVSMMNVNLFNYMMESADVPFPVLFVGDSVQIPPVDSGSKRIKVSDSAVFLPAVREKFLIEVHELTQVRRQADGNPIIKLATFIRNNYKGVIGDIAYRNLQNGEQLQVVDVYKAKESAIKWFLSDEYKQDPNYCRIVAYRNDTVRKYNEAIRALIYGKEESDNNKFLIDERIVFEEPYGESEFGQRYVVAQNSEEVRVSKIGEGIVKIVRPVLVGPQLEKNIEEIPVFVLSCIKEDDVNKPVVHIKVPKDVAAYNAILADIDTIAKQVDSNRRREVYRLKFEAREAVAWVNYAYAITAHKSQGSTYTNTLVILWDINTNPKIEERNRIAYVAVTRASDNLQIVL